ncbi:hypothetical protein T02_10597 [Trichinella nativa]|uniref:Uncharacterized protein n=1 Tax=Trichinella nativa TaxID=6335 RepID=A0A0V1L411_9BILA|nr:hypothetical protein T02_10597 [Trichinella nativa]
MSSRLEIWLEINVGHHAFPGSISPSAMLESHLHSKYQLQPDSRAALISSFGFALLLLCNYALILCRMPELTSSFQNRRRYMYLHEVYISKQCLLRGWCKL